MFVCTLRENNKSPYTDNPTRETTVERNESKQKHKTNIIVVGASQYRNVPKGPYIFANNPYCYSQDAGGDHEHHHRPFHVKNPNSYLAVREFFESTIAFSSSS